MCNRNRYINSEKTHSCKRFGGFLKDISVKIIDRLTGGNRMRESFWQYRLDCFAPKGLNTRQVDT